MYRAELPRTVTPDVVPSPVTAAAGAFAREFVAADTQDEDGRAIPAIGCRDRLIAVGSGRLPLRKFHPRRPGEERQAGAPTTPAGAIDLVRAQGAPIGKLDISCGKVRRDPATARLTEPIRGGE